MGGGVSPSGGELGLNERAWQIADAMAKNAPALRVALRQLPAGSRVLDAGVVVPGVFGAGGVGARGGRAAGSHASGVARRASFAGGGEFAAWIRDAGLQSRDTPGCNNNGIEGGSARGPHPPVAKNDLRAIGRTNACIL